MSDLAAAERMATKTQLRIRPTVGAETHAFDEWIAANHYLRSAPPVATLRLWVTDGDWRPLGALMFSRPSSQHWDWEGKVLELVRCCFIDDTPPYTESQALGAARKWIRQYCPQVKGLIAYSSGGQGHEGTIYMADGWFRLGKAPKNNTRDHRNNRTDRDLSEKSRWARSV